MDGALRNNKATATYEIGVERRSLRQRQAEHTRTDPLFDGGQTHDNQPLHAAHRQTRLPVEQHHVAVCELPVHHVLAHTQPAHVGGRTQVDPLPVSLHEITLACRNHVLERPLIVIGATNRNHVPPAEPVRHPNLRRMANVSRSLEGGDHTTRGVVHTLPRTAVTQEPLLALKQARIRLVLWLSLLLPPAPAGRLGHVQVLGVQILQRKQRRAEAHGVAALLFFGGVQLVGHDELL